jgi:hypothetical protein
MRVEYISHACLLIETADLKIVTDPWFNGAAYCGQWHVFPKPVNVDLLNDVDVIERKFFNIEFVDEHLVVSRSEAPASNSLLTMRLKSKILRYALENAWGADAINIGYGAEIFFSHERKVDVEHEKLCMKLLSRYPTVRSTLKCAPKRTIKFAVGNSPRYFRSIRELKRFNLESKNYSRATWLLKNADDIRKLYDLPELDADFFQ